MSTLRAIVVFVRAILRRRGMLALENLALRQQLAVLRWSVKQPGLRPRDWASWVLLLTAANAASARCRSEPASRSVSDPTEVAPDGGFGKDREPLHQQRGLFRVGTGGWAGPQLLGGRPTVNPQPRRRPFPNNDVSNAEIPAASMADIAFLLIIYFMVTMVFSATKAMDVPMPDQEPPPAPVADPSIYVRVLPDGGLSVDGQPMSLDDLLSYVVPKLRINQAKPIILHPHPETTYQNMIRVYDELLAAKDKTGFPIRNVTIPTEREIQEYIGIFGMNPFADPGG